jgi:hypothetical protein
MELADNALWKHVELYVNEWSVRLSANLRICSAGTPISNNSLWA